MFVLLCVHAGCAVYACWVYGMCMLVVRCVHVGCAAARMYYHNCSVFHKASVYRPMATTTQPHLNYSSSLCYANCAQIYIFKSCGCYASSLPYYAKKASTCGSIRNFNESTTVARLERYVRNIECQISAWKQFKLSAKGNRSTCDCPPQCKQDL